VQNDDEVKKRLPRLQNEFTSAPPVYLAVPLDDAENFREANELFAKVWETQLLNVYRIKN